MEKPRQPTTAEEYRVADQSFTLGDTVRLKSDTQAMTVEEVVDEWCLCVWIGGDEKRTAKFHRRTLVYQAPFKEA